MRTIIAVCPRKLADGSDCDAEQDVEVEMFYEGGWVVQFEVPDGCPDGHEWTDDEKRAIGENITEKAVDPPEPDEYE